jgi:serine/threonine protein kinase/tetratricopeptide (TPR) repeat protein
MGVVWKGVHRETGVAVAVKVITRAALLDDRIRESFRNEVKAVAGLTHPGIVWVFDTGEVDEVAAKASEGKLVAGGPYLAMEHASGGTLHGWTPPHWDAAREMILQVLDALGHAHARGVLHRDLKPPNVLRCTARDVRPGWKLVDFGIATLLDQTVEESINQGIIGTLAYMSPEQIRATWREYGPWTDLYALGCMLYRVIGGHRAFKERKGTALMIAQLNKSPVPLEPQVAVPQGLHEWMAKLLQKNPRDRFQSAADAALALSQLGGPVSTAPMAPIQLREEDDIITAPMSPDEIPTARDIQQPTLPRGGKHDGMFLLPLSWRRSESPRPPPRLVGAGMGLFDLREIPMAGRRTERDQLWRSLRAVHKSQRGRVVCLHGPSGVGTSRLAHWIGETAHELAGCRFLKAKARVGEEPQKLLVRLLHRELRTPRLDDDERLTRIQEELGLRGAAEVAFGRALSAMLSPTGQAHGQRVEGPARFQVARRALESMASDRPVVVVIDDVHLNADGLAFARHLAEAQAVRPSPVLVVLSWRDEAVAEDLDLSKEIEGLDQLEVVNLVPVAPLDSRDTARMIQELLPLERGLAARVEERVAGNPLFAAQLVRDWVREDKLVEGASGYELRDPGPITATVEDVWRRRVEKVVSGLPDGAQLLLELAAVLGLEVHEEEWQRVGDDPRGTYAATGQMVFKPEHAAWRRELTARMEAARLAEPTAEGFAFAQEMVREVLFAMAQERGRLGKNHRAAARTLLHIDAEQHCVRIGRHLVDGRYPAEAIPFLQQGVAMRKRDGGPRAALPVLALLERALREAKVPEDDPAWVQLLVERASIFNGLERFDDARHWAGRAERAAAAGDHRVLEARAVLELGRVQLAEREAEVADRSFARAESLLRDTDAPGLLGEVNYRRSMCARHLQEPARARAHALVAARYLTKARDESGLARGWVVLGKSSLLDGELDEAERYLWRAVRLHEADGDTLGMAACWTDLGTVARLRDDTASARALLDKALELYRQAGSPQIVHPQLEAARVAIVEKEWNEAWETASEVLDAVGWQGHSVLLVSTHAALATAAAGSGRWTELDLHLERVREGLSRIEVLEPDLAWALELAGDLAASGSRLAPARKAWKLALGLQNTVDPTRARVTERKLASAR